MKLLARFKRPADITIGVGYLERWYIIPRNPYFNVYLHKFSGSDDDRALHDHPWWSVSFLLKGAAQEILINRVRIPRRFVPVVRCPDLLHRIVIVNGPVWTLFITGPRVRAWGFLCPQGWRHWREFTDDSGNKIGRGCK